tara:strand:+ start:5513 stop:6013 length:501 start_codon:yes stop_codon:yes gene_type:complete
MTTMAIMSVAASAASTAMTTMSANAQADAEFKAAEQQRKAEEQEALRLLAQEQQESLDQQSDVVRTAQKELGDLQASETMLTESSLGSILFTGEYGTEVGLGRISEKEARDVGLRKSQQLGAINEQANRGNIAAAKASAQISKAVAGTISTAASVGMKAAGAPTTP